MAQSLIHSIALNEVLFQHSVGPLTELYTPLALHTIADGNDDIQSIECGRLFHTINTQKMRVNILW